MQPLGSSPSRAWSSTSWLTLVAETAGVVGAVITRVELRLEDTSFVLPSGTFRALVQIRDEHDVVVEATQVWGDGRDFSKGIFADLGCDLTWRPQAEVVAWIDETSIAVTHPLRPRDPRSESIPAHASRCRLEAGPMKLRLSLPLAKLIDAA